MTLLLLLLLFFKPQHSRLQTVLLRPSFGSDNPRRTLVLSKFLFICRCLMELGDQTMQHLWKRAAIHTALAGWDLGKRPFIIVQRHVCTLVLRIL